MPHQRRKSNGELLIEFIVWSFEGSYLRTLSTGICLVFVFSYLVPRWFTLSAPQGSSLASAFWNAASYSEIAGLVAGAIFGIATLWKLWPWERDAD